VADAVASVEVMIGVPEQAEAEPGATLAVIGGVDSPLSRVVIVAVVPDIIVLLALRYSVAVPPLGSVKMHVCAFRPSVVIPEI
jgi:hypothetical protein